MPSTVEDAVPDPQLSILGANNCGVGGNVRLNVTAHEHLGGETTYVQSVARLPDNDYSIAAADADHFDLIGTSGNVVTGTGACIRDASVLICQPDSLSPRLATPLRRAASLVAVPTLPAVSAIQLK